MTTHQMLRFLRRLRGDEAGFTAVYVGIGMMVFVGAAGLAVDAAAWYRAKRMAQTAADAAAYAGALDLARQGLDDPNTVNQTALLTAANDAATRNGMTLSVNVQYPPNDGIEINDPQSVEVNITEPAPMIFTTAFMNAAPQVQARAVAKAVVADACLFALNPTVEGALTVTGSSNVQLGCGAVVNSTHDSAALDQNGMSCISATAITIAGGYGGNCVSPEPEVYTPQYGDPLSWLAMPTVGACDYMNVHVSGGGPNDFDGNNNGIHEFTPGVYCGGLVMSGGTSSFAPGLYIIDGGEFRVAGSATVSNSNMSIPHGVTFYLTAPTTLWIASGADVTLSAPTVGTYAEILFMQDPSAPQGNENKFVGGSTMDLEGAIYFPSALVEFSGGTSSDAAQVLLIGDTIKFSGSSFVSADYSGGLLKNNAYVRLVE